MRRIWFISVGVSLVVCFTEPASGKTAPISTGSASATPSGWPDTTEIVRVLTLGDYNTRVVVLGTTLLGIAAGVIGTFAYLRKRAMMGDALSHATLPGIALAFILVGAKQLPVLLLGAVATGVLGVLAVICLSRFSRLKEDAAIGIVLSVFFGIGMVLISLIQQMSTGNEAGLMHFIYGRAASMIRGDAQLIAGVTLLVTIICILLYKEFRLICFDQQYASSQGWPVFLIDVAMMALVVLTTVIGLQTVGLIMIVALLIIPAATARFWTDHLGVMTLLAAIFGALSGWLGSSISALFSRLPTGAIIVVTAGAFFLLSMFLSPHRGVLASVLRQFLLRRRVSYQHLLRALAEFEESGGADCRFTIQSLLFKRSWTTIQIRKLIKRARRQKDLAQDQDQHYHLTEQGRARARRMLRNHRLWETFLIRYADIAPSHVDRDADEVEHVLSPEIVQDLERVLKEEKDIPPSPHAVEVGA